MRCRAAVVEQARFGEQESAGADRSDTSRIRDRVLRELNETGRCFRRLQGA
jgi:hypothetical protein